MWYYSAILWAYENKIVKGIGTDIFAPDKGITREELVNIIAAYEKFKGKTVIAGNADMSVFKDLSQSRRFSASKNSASFLRKSLIAHPFRNQSTIAQSIGAAR